MLLFYFIHVLNVKKHLKVETSSYTEEGRELRSTVVEESNNIINKSIFNKSILPENLRTLQKPLSQKNIELLIKFTDKRTQVTLKEYSLNDEKNINFNNLESFKDYFLSSVSQEHKKFYLQVIFLTLRFFMFLRENDGFKCKEREQDEELRIRLVFLLKSLCDHNFLNKNKNNLHYSFADGFLKKVLKGPKVSFGELEKLQDIKEKFEDGIQQSYMDVFRNITVEKYKTNIIDSIVDALFKN